MAGMAKLGAFTGDLIMPQFILKIDLGNDAMQSDDNIAWALRDVAHRIEYDGIYYKPQKRILDQNGNVVGHYEVIP